MLDKKLVTIFNELINKQPLRVKLGGHWCVAIKLTGRMMDNSHEIVCKNGDGWQITTTINKIESLSL